MFSTQNEFYVQHHSKLILELLFVFTASLWSFTGFEIRQYNSDVVVTWDTMEKELKADYANAIVNVVFTVERKPNGGMIS
jgi:hypothetical protein